MSMVYVTDRVKILGYSNSGTVTSIMFYVKDWITPATLCLQHKYDTLVSPLLDGKLEPWIEVSLYKFNHYCNLRLKVLMVHSEHSLCDIMDHTVTSWFTVQVVHFLVYSTSGRLGPSLM